MHLFTTLGQHKRLFWSWLPFELMLVSVGKLPKHDTELVILRVGHLRDCAYQVQQHRRIAKRRSLDADMQAKIFEGTMAPGLTDRQRVLLTATDELVRTARFLELAHGRMRCLKRPHRRSLAVRAMRPNGPSGRYFTPLAWAGDSVAA
jgi:AhpD family alkylhydroperoxidase